MAQKQAASSGVRDSDGRSKNNDSRAYVGSLSLFQLLLIPYVAALLVIVGTTLVLYPTAASWVSQYNQTELTGDYSSLVSRVVPDREAQLEAAKAYNTALSSGALLGRNERIPSSIGDLDEITAPDGRVWTYDDILAASDNGIMSRIRIDAIDLDLPIYHGTSDETLMKGAGHLQGTSFPIGGPSTRTVITAHRGLATATMFTDLDKVEVGDTFTLETFGEVLTYRVITTEVVEPDDTQTIRAVEGKDLATLVTCTPLGINSHRILVTGERIIPTPAGDVDRAGKHSDLPKFPWWAVLYAVVVLGTVGFTVRYTLRMKRAVRLRDALEAEQNRTSSTGADGEDRASAEG
ncbi:class C sortase [Alloscardovia criceti]|uniref:class C sortase n=1 Tax=Alloscardovia criceti TaxID=356828 RepID=UPI0003641C1F|nr:class C sortase [Alloscardovia criceti]